MKFPVGHLLTKADRRRAVAAVVSLCSGWRAASIVGERVSMLADGRAVTEDLAAWLARAATADPSADHCPWCLDRVERSGLCATCEPEHRIFKLEGAEAAAARWRAGAKLLVVPPKPRKEKPAPPVKPQRAEAAPPPAMPEPPAPAVLDRFDLYAVRAMCASKRGYPSQIEADKTAARCMRKRGGFLRAYPCPACGWWHLTHKREQRPLAQVAR